MAHALLSAGRMQLYSGVEVMRAALDFHLRRHTVLASNVANVSTPGFAPFDLVRAAPEANGGGPRPLGLATHDASSSFADLSRPEVAADLVEDRTVMPGADGNSVSLEREAMKISANQLRFEGAARIVARQLAMLRYAANDATGG